MPEESWTSSSCTSYCSDMGAKHLGCGADKEGFTSCLCSGGDEDVEQREPFSDPGCRGWDFYVKNQSTRYVTDDGDPYYLYMAFSSDTTPLDIPPDDDYPECRWFR